METTEKIRKIYKKPRLTQVKLQIEEAVLQPCKASQGDSAGKGTKRCGHSGCRTTFGT
jgi:hypothetical protein